MFRCPVRRLLLIVGCPGPKVNTVEKLGELRKAGVNIGIQYSLSPLSIFLRLRVVRMNFSHGSYEYHQSVIDNTRKMIAGTLLHRRCAYWYWSLLSAYPNGRPVAIALDTVSEYSTRHFTQPELVSPERTWDPYWLDEGQHGCKPFFYLTIYRRTKIENIDCYIRWPRVYRIHWPEIQWNMWW